MTRHDRSLREALRRAVDLPGTDGVVERVAHHRARYRRRNRLSRVALVVVVIAAVSSATWLLARTLGVGAGTPATHSSTGKPVPSPHGSAGGPAPFPSATGGGANPTPTGSASCIERTALRGDFDGDGKVDSARLSDSGGGDRWILPWTGRPLGSWQLDDGEGARSSPRRTSTETERRRSTS